MSEHVCLHGLGWFTSSTICPSGGLSGATIIDSLDTLYLMELKEEFQEAKAWVEESFHLNVVSPRPSNSWHHNEPKGQGSLPPDASETRGAEAQQSRLSVPGYTLC